VSDRYELEFSRYAQRQIRRIEPQVRRRIRSATDALRDDPRPAGVRAIVGSLGLLRIRVGDYRVIYSVDDGRLVVLVVEVGHRGAVYR
jgi:mRNA interferase RelE/StbE